jgi:hypothetical protein
MMRRIRTSAEISLALVAIAAAVAGCTGDDQASPLEGQAALVITTDYQTGSYAAVRLADLAVVPNIEVIHQDAVCRFDPITGFPLVVARLGADAIDIVDPAQSWQVVGEYSVGAGTNLQDIAVVSSERAYVSRMGEATLLVVHPLDGAQLDEIDLSAYADADGLPEPAGLVHLDGKVYVLLLRLANLLATDYSLMLVLDAASGAIEDEIELSASNPSGVLRYSEPIGALVLVEPGDFGNHDDGGIELYYPATGELSGLVIDEQALGGDAVDAVILSETKGYAIVGEVIGTEGKTRVVSFDPSTGTKTGDLIADEAWNHMTLELTPDGSQLWVPDRKLTAPGIRIFDATTDQELTEAPIDVGLPPFAICFVQYE